MAPAIRQVIEVVTKFVDGHSQKVREVSQSIQNLGGRYQKLINTTKTLNEKTGRLSKTMETHRVVSKKFRMELLGVMFLGLFLVRVFGGLIKTSLEWYGINEILTMALGLLFLPIAEFLLGPAIQFLEWVSGLTEGQKKLIGWLVLGGIILGGLLFIFGQVGLGLASLQMAFGAAAGASGVGGLVGALKNLGKIVAVAIGITITLASISLLSTGISEGSLLKELGGIIGMGLGLGAIGLAIGGPLGAGIGAIIGVTLGVVIDLVFSITKGKGIFANLRDKFAETIQNIQDSGMFTPPSAVQKLTGRTFSPGMEGYADGGIVPGNIGSPVPIIAHAGERILPVGGSSSGSGSMMMNVTYNVNVSDKREFESMLNANNIKLADDVRRLVKA